MKNQEVKKSMETKDNESGRSMVETLGVLAIMGVLAIGGIAGYRWAMDKYNANEILNEVRKRAVTASQQRILGHAINLSEYGNNTIQGHTVTTADNYDGDTNFFTITIEGIEKDICDKIIKEKISFAVDMWVGDDADECAEGLNDMTIVFSNTLDEQAVLPKEDKPICETDSDCASVEGKPVCVDGTCQIGYYCQGSSLYRSDIGLIQTCESGCSRQTPIYYSSDKEAFVNLCYVPQCKWTGLLNSGRPAFDKTSGDFESLEDICEWGWAADISCRATMYPSVPIWELGQAVTCNTSVGLVCRNQDQKPGGPIPMPYCLDYEINVYCCDVSDMPEAPVEEKRVCNTKGQCFFCSVAVAIPVKSQADCAVCDGTNGTTKRYYWKGYCYTTCPDNTTASGQECVPNKDAYCYDSSCYSCSDSNLNQYIGTSSEAQSYCASCDGTNGTTRRFYGNGSCYSCSFSGSVYVGETEAGKAVCLSCNTETEKQRYYNESNGHVWCRKCPTSLSSTSLNTQEKCTQCGGTWNGSKCS